MTSPWTGNWACTTINAAAYNGASAEELSALLARHPRFVAAIQNAIDSAPTSLTVRGVDGGMGVGEIAIDNLVDALHEIGEA